MTEGQKCPADFASPPRGNNKQPVFSTDADRQRFLDLVEQHSEERDVRVAACTLLSNHFHLVAVGDRRRRRSALDCRFIGVLPPVLGALGSGPAEVYKMAAKCVGSTMDTQTLAVLLGFPRPSPFMSHSLARAKAARLRHVVRLN